jgi:restriction system protein
MKRNQESPWNPGEPVTVTPREYEQQIVTWLQNMAEPLTDFTVKHLEDLEGAGGEYQFDAVARFSALGGAEFIVLIECKRWKRPVGRDVLLATDAKLKDVGAHKAMVFSTSGFQSGAIQYATSRGIATVSFVDGRSLYETKAMDGSREPPPWVDLPRFAGQTLTADGTTIRSHICDDDQVEALDEWFGSGPGSE